MNSTRKTRVMLPVEHAAGEDIAVRFASMLEVAGRAGERQRAETPVFGLTSNLGGFPHWKVCSVKSVDQESI